MNQNMSAAQAAQQNNRDNGGRYAIRQHAEVVGIGLVEDDKTVIYPQAGTSSAFAQCPAHRGGACYKHGSKPGPHDNDMEIRACIEYVDEEFVDSNASEAEAEFWTVYTRDEDGISMALEDFDSRDEAVAFMRETATEDPADIEAVRAAADLIDHTDTDQIRALAQSSLAHLPEERRKTIERALELTPNSASALYGALVDATQDVPTREKMKQLTREIDRARTELTQAYVLRDTGDPNADEVIEEARASVEKAREKLSRADKLREDASVRRIAVGRPTFIDGSDVQDRANNARAHRRHATYRADSVRGLNYTDPVKQAAKVEELTRVEAEEAHWIAEQVRTKKVLDEFNDAWRRMQGRG